MEALPDSSLDQSILPSVHSGLHPGVTDGIKQKKILQYLFFLSVVLFSGACTNLVLEDSVCEADNLDRNLSYNLDVSPIIRNACAIPSCHVTGFEPGDFTSFNVIKEKADTGLLEYKITTNQMPHPSTKGPKALTECEKSIIITWIREGSLNN